MTKKISTSNQFLIEANSLSIQYNKIKSEIEKIYDPMKIYNSDFPDYIVDGMDKNQIIKNQVVRACVDDSSTKVRSNSDETDETNNDEGFALLDEPIDSLGAALHVWS